MCRSIKRAVRSRDLFGAPVMLTFNGESQFKTWQGGLVSILILLSLAGGLSYRLYQELNAPEFISLPPLYDYNDSKVNVKASDNTMLVRMKAW